MPSFASTESARSSSEPEATDLLLRRRNTTMPLATHSKTRCESADAARRTIASRHLRPFPMPWAGAASR